MSSKEEKQAKPDNLFGKEEKFLASMMELEDQADPENFAKLTKEYKKLLRQTKKLVSIGDRTQKDLYNTRSELQEQYKTIDKQLTHAAKYVVSLLPTAMASKLFEFSWKFVPSYKLAGDSFGYHWIDDKNIALYLIDVCGHGVGPALHSVSVSNAIRFQTLVDADYLNPDSVLFALNNAFGMTTHSNLYFSMWYCVYNIETNEFTYCGAGHPPFILMRGENEPEYLDTPNIAVGIMTNFQFTSKTVTLKPNDVLYFYTDGAYEINTSETEMMSYQEMAEYLASVRSQDNSELETLYYYLLQIGNLKNLDDDYTILKFAVK